jgi:hypothetical protein
MMTTKEAMVSSVPQDKSHPAAEPLSIKVNRAKTTTIHRDIFTGQVSTPETPSHHKTHNHLDSQDLKAIYLAVISRPSQALDSNNNSNKFSQE